MYHIEESSLFSFIQDKLTFCLWSTDPDVSCGDPGQITHATRSGTSFDYRGTVTYSCTTGYVRTSGINGDITLTCGIDGLWTGQDTCTGESSSSMGNVRVDGYKINF